MTVDDPTPNVGDFVTFTVTLKNNGPDAATNVTVGDLLPSGLSFDSATTFQGVYNPATGAWTVGTVAGNGSTTLVLTATVTSPSAATNAASVAASDQYDGSSANDSASATETPQRADLGLTFAVDNSTPNVGDVVTFTATLTNSGPDAATSVDVSALLPAGLTLVSATPGQGSYDPATGAWTVGTVAGNGSTTLVLTATVAAPDAATDTASVGHADQYDADPGDNTASASVAPQRADLGLSMAVDNPAPRVGDTITLTLTLTNAGPDAATNVRVSDPLPAGLALVSAVAGQGTYDPATGLWTVGAVASGGSTVLTLRVKIVGTDTQLGRAEVEHQDQYAASRSAGVAVVAVVPRSSLAGRVYLDANRNGAFDAGDVPIPGVTVTLAGSDTDENSVLLTATTDASGLYQFSGLMPGSYALTGSRPSGYTPAGAVAGTAGGTSGGGLTVDDIELGSGTSAGGYLFPMTAPSLSGRAFLDANADGRLGPGERGMGGVGVSLLDPQGHILATATTAADGSYTFPNRLPGAYTVALARPAGYGASTPTRFAAAQTLAGLAGQNFGLTTSSLSGSVFRDANGNGARNPGEPGVGGVAVTLTGADVTGKPVRAAAVTAADGSYRFAGLLAGTYSVTYASPAGVLAGKATTGTAGGQAGLGRVDAIPLGAGAGASGYGLGAVSPAALAGVVHAGLGCGAAGVAGAGVVLTGVNDLGQPVAAVTLADGRGAYAFTGLRPGVYSVAPVAPCNAVPVAEAVGTAGGVAGAGRVAGIPLGPGAFGRNYLFAELPVCRPVCRPVGWALPVVRAVAPCAGAIPLPAGPLAFRPVPTPARPPVLARPGFGRVKVVCG